MARPVTGRTIQGLPDHVEWGNFAPRLLAFRPCSFVRELIRGFKSTSPRPFCFGGPMVPGRDHVLWSVSSACTQTLVNAIYVLHGHLRNVERVFELVPCRLKQ